MHTCNHKTLLSFCYFEVFVQCSYPSTRWSHSCRARLSRRMTVPLGVRRFALCTDTDMNGDAHVQSCASRKGWSGYRRVSPGLFSGGGASLRTLLFSNSSWYFICTDENLKSTRGHRAPTFSRSTPTRSACFLGGSKALRTAEHSGHTSIRGWRRNHEEKKPLCL